MPHNENRPNFFFDPVINYIDVGDIEEDDELRK